MLTPGKSVDPFDVELFLEANGNGYTVHSAEISADAGLDGYERRCFEVAFEKHISLGDKRNAIGVLYHLSFPVSVPTQNIAVADAG